MSTERQREIKRNRKRREERFKARRLQRMAQSKKK